MKKCLFLAVMLVLAANAAWAADDQAPPAFKIGAWGVAGWYWTDQPVVDEEGREGPNNEFYVERMRLCLAADYGRWSGWSRVDFFGDGTVRLADFWGNYRVASDKHQLDIRLGKQFISVGTFDYGVNTNPWASNPEGTAVVGPFFGTGLQLLGSHWNILNWNVALFNGQEPENNDNKDAAGKLSFTTPPVIEGLDLSLTTGAAVRVGRHAEGEFQSGAVFGSLLLWQVELKTEFQQVKLEEVSGNGFVGAVIVAPIPNHRELALAGRYWKWQPDVEVDLADEAWDASISYDFGHVVPMVNYCNFRQTGSEVPDNTDPVQRVDVSLLFTF